MLSVHTNLANIQIDMYSRQLNHSPPPPPLKKLIEFGQVMWLNHFGLGGLKPPSPPSTPWLRHCLLDLLVGLLARLPSLRLPWKQVTESSSLVYALSYALRLRRLV